MGNVNRKALRDRYKVIVGQLANAKLSKTKRESLLREKMAIIRKLN